MQRETNNQKCIFCGNDKLIKSEISLPINPGTRVEIEIPVPITKDGSPFYRYDEFIDLTIKRCSECNYLHFFYIPDSFKRTPIK
ncbi:MAG: hypothetical protein RL637_1261 [Pseudomonadota bacterium]|jgi:predicted nucleic-acid-binding Zn-ribbon protein